MKKRIGIQGAIMVFATLAGILLYKFVFANRKRGLLDESLETLGIILVLSGFLFRITARGYKEDNSRCGYGLVKDGPYGLLRNPMYFGTLLIGAGVISIIFELWIFPLFLIIFLSIYIPQINREEVILYKRFGKEYEDYRKETPKYLPNFNYLLKNKNYALLKWPWVKKESVSLIVVLGFILTIEIWEDISLFDYKGSIKEALGLISIIASFAGVVILFQRLGTTLKKRSSKLG